MPKNPELDQFRLEMQALRRNPLLRAAIQGDALKLGDLSIDKIRELASLDAGYYFLIAAAGLNRTSLKRTMREPVAQIVAPRLRRAHAIKSRLPLASSFRATVETALALRESDLGRKNSGGAEQVFRERLLEEGIPLLMSPPPRRVPGLLVGLRKPDGVYPDPSGGKPPRVYLEVKNVRRVADDIQKRLYEIAEASLEMKAIYGNLRLDGLGVESTRDVQTNPQLRTAIRSQISASLPIVVALFICPTADAERYREGAETFIDRVFFQEEIEACLAFLKASIGNVDVGESSPS